MVRWGSCSSILVGALLFGAPTAHAQSAALEVGRRLSESAHFERALVALDRADEEPLTREERSRLYATRAMVAFALGRPDDARADLARMLAMGAEDGLPPSAPPPLMEMVEELRREGVRPPRISSDARVEDGVARVEVTAEGGADLLRETRLWADAGGWRAVGTLEERLEPGGPPLRWYAEALGPHGVRLATEGTRELPNVLSLRAEEASAESSGGDEGWWAALGAGGAAVVVGVSVAVGVALGTGSSDGTQLSGPTLQR